MSLPQLDLLGPPRLRTAEGELLGGRKELALLAYVACRGPRAVGRAELTDVFWGDRDETRARQSLRQALAKLRRALGDALAVTPDGVALDPDAVALDVARFEAALRAGRDDDAAALWRGDFLAGMDDAGAGRWRGWLESERESLRRRLAAALERLTAGTGGEDALRWAGLWADHFPLDERAHAALADALVRADRADEAAARLHAFAGRLRAELGVEPSAALLARADASAAGSPRPLPASAVAAAPGSVALFSPSLTGRDAALAELRAAFAASAAGEAGLLMVVEGEEGIGKTRLCEEYLREVERSTTPALVLRARAAAGEGLRELLAPLAAAPGLGGAGDAALARLARHVPALRARYPHLPEVEHHDAALPAALRETLDAVAAELPVLLFVDDLDGADGPMRQALLALARDLPRSVLLLLTGRGEALQREGISPLVGPLPGARRLLLQPLTPAETEGLIGSMLELRPAARQSLAARLCEAGGGNPSFVVEMVAALADTGQLVLAEGGVWELHAAELGLLPVPAGLREAVLQRLGRLSVEGRAVLRVAAAAPAPVDAESLETATGLDADRVGDAIDELAARRLLRRRPSGGFDLANEVVRRVILEQRGPAGSDGPAASVPAVAPPATAGRAAAARVGLRRRPAALALVAALLLAVAGILAFGTRPVPVEPGTVAVLPFEYRGSEELRYLGEGFADLLGLQLDGAGEMRSVDPRALLAFVAQNGRPRLDPEGGRALAARFGAGQYVLGSVVESGGGLQVQASLYRLDGQLVASASASTDEETGVTGLVDDLARQLLAGRFRGAGAPLVRTASLTTGSLPALKAYLEGERLLRSGDFARAAAAFSGAAETDTLFALAHYRLGVALEWLPADAPAIDRAIEAATRHAHRLPQRSRFLVEAASARRRGDVRDADSLYMEVLALARDDFDATFQLAETRFHDAPVRGHDIAEAKPLWRRLLALDADNAFAIVHLARIAASQDSLGHFFLDHADAVRTLPVDDRRGAELVLWRTLHEGSRVADGPLAARLRDPSVYTPIAQIVAFSRDPVATERMLREMRGLRSVTYLDEVLLAHTLAAQGRWRAADSVLAAAGAVHHPRVLPHRVLLAALAANWSDAGPAALLPEVARWRSVGQAEHPAIRLFLQGLLAGAAGDERAMQRYAAELERVADVPLLHDLALALRTDALRRQGRAQEAVALHLQATMQAAWDQSFNSPFHSRVTNRWVHAESLREAGQDRQALRWYTSLGQASPFEIAYVAPAHLRRAEIHDRLGERAQALEHYRRFADLWRHADAELQPRVRAARERIARLDGAAR